MMGSSQARRDFMGTVDSRWGMGGMLVERIDGGRVARGFCCCAGGDVR